MHRSETRCIIKVMVLLMVVVGLRKWGAGVPVTRAV